MFVVFFERQASGDGFCCLSMFMMACTRQKKTVESSAIFGDVADEDALPRETLPRRSPKLRGKYSDNDFAVRDKDPQARHHLVARRIGFLSTLRQRMRRGSTMAAVSTRRSACLETVMLWA